MGRYVIERSLPGAGALRQEDLADLSRKSNDVLADLGEEIAWVQSYVTGDKLYCVYDANDPELIAEHARRGGFPCDRVSEVRTVISPDTGR
ncbi:hypothetical protein CFN78_03575 [Amycolatopsis antarctica]|uniref:DUF4242 domain-containing protein n=1 Tax=Amycolatopsis antarctica TaxID=1854586 RepID=A0A263D6U6_9PSEU|nr:DUF4242 domain-containing protein [Amycolatopsis antarctica]OZM74244.1 hypothetical protein CFN78_03575 [Amycolatopsis antarctica]